MTFSEQDVNREQDGKFGEKVGAAPGAEVLNAVLADSAARRERNAEVANIALGQLDVWTRGCLDIKGSKVSPIDEGFHASDVLISTGPNRRGNITLKLNGNDLYDIEFTNKRFETVDSYTDLDVAQYAALMKSKAGL